MKRTFVQIVVVAIGAMFLYTGVAKLIFPGHAVLALYSLEMPFTLADYLVYAVVVIELYLGTLLVFRLDLKWALAASMALMFSFTCYMWYLSTLANPPSCGCLGLTSVFDSSRGEAIFGLGRNVALLFLLKFAFDHHVKSASNEYHEVIQGNESEISSV